MTADQSVRHALWQRFTFQQRQATGLLIALIVGWYLGQLAVASDWPLHRIRWAFTVVETDDADSVTITRNPTYVADEVNVRVTGPEDEPKYSLTINMTTGTIASFTDWDETQNG